MYSAFQPSNLGDEMPKRRKEGRGPDFYVFLLILVVLVLKGLGFLKAWFNIDPNGLTLDAGDLATFGGFLYLWRNFDKEAKTLKRAWMTSLRSFTQSYLNRARDWRKSKRKQTNSEPAKKSLRARVPTNLAEKAFNSSASRRDQSLIDTRRCGQ